jgi:hypothetical protein
LVVAFVPPFSISIAPLLLLSSSTAIYLPLPCRSSQIARCSAMLAVSFP